MLSIHDILGSGAVYLLLGIIILIPYLTVFILLMAARCLTPLNRLPTKPSLLGAAAISILITVILTLISGEPPLRFAAGFIGTALRLLPYLLIIGIAALLPNLKALLETDEKIALKARRTVISALLCGLLLFGGLTYYNYHPYINIPGEYKPYMTDERIDSLRQSLCGYGPRHLTFTLQIDVTYADADGFSGEATYFILGRQLGVSEYMHEGEQRGELYDPTPAMGPFG